MKLTNEEKNILTASHLVTHNTVGFLNMSLPNLPQEKLDDLGRSVVSMVMTTIGQVEEECGLEPNTLVHTFHIDNINRFIEIAGSAEGQEHIEKVAAALEEDA